MHLARPALLLLLASSPLLAQSNTVDAGTGLSILQQMSRHYADAHSWYIAATQERTSETENSRNWDKETMVAAVSGNSYHYEGHGDTGSAFHISDGHTAWDLHSEEHAYSRGAAPDHGYQRPKIWQMNEQGAQQAFDLRKHFANFAAGYTAADRLPDQAISQQGVTLSCYVVRVSTAQRKGPKPAGTSSEETLWIDQTTWAVHKTVEQGTSFLYTGTARLPTTQRTVTDYDTALLDTQPPEALFRFTPPTDARLVATFSDSISGLDMTGEAAPDVQLPTADGKRVPLSSYRGKPVLLDFWATWCGPCVAAMPALAKLHQQAAPKGLVLLSVDEDQEEKTAKNFLAKHNYTWLNTQDEGPIGDAFQKLGIPLFVLIDAQGKIVYYKTGEDDTGLRKALAALGPAFTSLAPPEKPPQPCTALITSSTSK